MAPKSAASTASGDNIIREYHSETANTYRDSPFGLAIHPHLNEPDTKYNVGGLFHVDLKEVKPGDFAEDIERIKLEADRVFNWYVGTDAWEKIKNKPKQKPITVFYPFEDGTDREGERDGTQVLSLKQNATINVKGVSKAITIGLYDSDGKAMSKPIWGGSIIRANYAMRPFVATSLGLAGVRLVFGRVQVKELRTAGQGGGGGFGAVEDGYKDDGFGPAPGGGGGSEPDDPSKDY